LIIGIDLQTLETPEADRGIGRYARGIVENLARLSPQHRIVGFGFGDQPPHSLTCTAVENFEYRQFDLPHERLAYLSEGILAPFAWSPRMQDLDFYLVTSPLMPDILIPDGAPFPVVALVHDLIPLVFRQSHPEQMSEFAWHLYDLRLEVLKDYDYCLTNSEFTREEVCRLLGLRAERVHALGVGIGEEFFHPLSAATMRQVREKCAIGLPYVLSVSGYHYRKNWETLFRSFAELPPADRKSHNLVVVCKLDACSRTDFLALAKQLGIASEIVLTDAVDEETLRGLYQGASALVLSSLHEGFGIPLIEAMAAGTPIVASDIPVFREVCGEAARYADPMRADLFAEAIQAVLHDGSLRRELVEEGRRRVEFYRWPRILERAETFLNQIAARETGREKQEVRRERQEGRGSEQGPGGGDLSATRPTGLTGPTSPTDRVAYFTLLPPQVSGIADYNESLVQELAKHVQLELFLDDIVPVYPEIRENIVWHSSRDFRRFHHDHPYDLVVYHMGNNVLHGRQYRMATAYPGIVMLHDYSLRLFAPLANRRFSFLETRDDIERYYGLSFPHSMPLEHIFQHLNVLDHPLNERLIERSLGVVVHSQWSRSRIHRRFADKPVEVVPFGVDHDPRKQIPAREEVRRRYHISPKAFVVTCAGNLTPPKRLTTILHAFAEIVDSVPNAILCLVGQATDPQYFRRLHQLVGELRLNGFVRFLGYVGMAELYDILDISDVCLNLRYPTLGETSAVLLRMMYLGKPIIVSGIAQFLEFPDTVCWKTDVAEAEHSQLVRYLYALERSPQLRCALGENARRYVQGWTWDRVALHHVEAWRRITRQTRPRGESPTVPLVAFTDQTPEDQATIRV